MTTTLLLIRHGAHDLAGRTLTGRMPGITLNKTGRLQAEQLAGRLARWPVQEVYAGPLTRVQATGLPLARHLGLTLKTLETFDEIETGEWTGMPFVLLQDDPAWMRWNRQRSLARCPGGESFVEVQARVANGLDQLRGNHPDQTIAVVSHSDVIKAALACLLGLPLEFYDRIEIDPASVSVAVYGNWGAKILKLNEGADAMSTDLQTAEIRAQIEALGPWFHNLDLCGVPTAPDHFLGDYPRVKFRRFADALPSDLSGKSVLDIGCNAGFYSIEMKRRGAKRVLGIDFDEKYLAQARYAAEISCQKIEFRLLSVYDLALLRERFDIVIFMGVFYHLRHPLLALDLIREHVAGDIMIFQSMQRGSNQVDPLEHDYDFFDIDHFDRPGFPKMHFIEQRYASDPTNWWAPNRACTEAMLRSAGFDIMSRPEEEVYLCRCAAVPFGADAVYPARSPEERCS